MKKIVRIIYILVLITILFGCINSNATNNKEKFSVVLNPKQDESKYKEREVNILGFKLIYEDEILFNGENNSITEKQKDTNNIIIGVFSVGLVVYWLVLLLIYEREDTNNYIYENEDDIKTLRKYNPMLAGCLVDNREVLCRDVTAVVLNLIQKQVINMQMIPNLKGKDTYTYMISENKKSTVELDEIERYILKWIFGFYEQEEVDLIKKLKELSRRKDFMKNIKKLNSIAQKELNSRGANISRVPLFIKVVNFFLVIFSVGMATVHIINNGLDVHIYQTTILLIYLIAVAIIVVLPIVALTIHLILFMIVIFKRIIKSTAERCSSGKKIISTSMLILLSMTVLIFIIYFIVPNKYICLDIFMIGMSILIVKTDNLMTKHNKEVLNDYYSLQEIKYKIEEYSLIKDEQINYIKLWEEYLVYAVAFGIPIPIVNKLKETYKEDKDIKYLLKCESLYYVCKAYFEVMWQMDFKEKKQKYNIGDLFGIAMGINKLIGKKY